jgi:glycosyltransferase involved in cell wall biosynthesis
LPAIGSTVFCSASLRDRVGVATGWDVREADVSWLGVSPKDFPLREARPRPWQGRLLFVGRLTEAKGATTLVRAMEHLPPDTTLTMLGTAASSDVRALRDIAEEIGCGDRVSIAQRPRAELAAAYQDADALVFPSEWEEPFGIVPLEAMACGTPVVATGTGGSGEYLRHGDCCLLFPAGDPQALAAAVLRLAGDPDLRDRLVEHGRRQAVKITTNRLAADLEAIHQRAAR